MGHLRTRRIDPDIVEYADMLMADIGEMRVAIANIFSALREMNQDLLSYEVREAVRKAMSIADLF